MPDDSAFCQKCGTKVAESNAPAAQKPIENQCPKCGGTNISFQWEQTAKVDVGTNKVVIQQAKKSKGCMYWVFIGWWWQLIYWICFGLWKNMFFGGKKRGGLNLHADKAINHTVAVCQSCGHSWKVK